MKREDKALWLAGLLLGFVFLFTPPSAFAGASISLSGSTWAIGYVTTSQGTSTSPVNNWTVTNDSCSGAAAGVEDIDISVSVSSPSGSSWLPWETANNSNTANYFILRENNSSGTLIKSSNVRLKDNLAGNSTYSFGLWFQAPPSGSEEGAHTLTVTLTATGWSRC